MWGPTTTAITFAGSPDAEPAALASFYGFIDPGGPGGSGIDVALEAPDFFGAAVRRRYDVLGFDPRGMGGTRLNYYGARYGTEVGALYADLFTSRARLMVLDAAVATDAVAEPGPS
ncbi:MAG: hypothetical protein ABI336_01985 [Humibacillus sp.]